jgi:DNA-binding XRE family transcriptional regulator
VSKAKPINFRNTTPFKEILARESKAFQARVAERAAKLAWRVDFARRFRAIVAKSLLNQNQLAKASGQSRQVIGDYYHGRKCPCVYTLLKLCRALGVSAAHLIGE